MASPALAQSSTSSAAAEAGVYVPPVLLGPNDRAPPVPPPAVQPPEAESEPGVEPDPEPAPPKPERAEADGEDEAARFPESEVIRVVGTALDRVAGSVQLIDEEALTRFDYDDVARALVKVPGVYIRDEDGFGLRPNIGIRGANSDRSAKITLMEDGILLGPAPYSAPAAYYVPLATRMVGLEVFKGPSAVRSGPFTVGGAVNYVTAEIPIGAETMVDVSGGQFGYLKGHFRHGYGGEHFGFLVEGVKLRTTGFKELDGGGDTGFDKSEVMGKFRLSAESGGGWYHRLELKLGWSEEGSNETYLGLTESDFRQTPYRRYAASALDRMDWERTQVELAYNVFSGEDFEARLVGYHHDFHRAWFKFNGVEGNDTSRILRNPTGTNAIQYAGLTGDEALEGILIGTNDRSFISQGIQLDGDLEVSGDWLSQKIRFGARLHFDRIRRRHTERSFRMEVTAAPLGTLVQTSAEPMSTRDNEDSALAFSAYLQDELTLFEQLTLSPGLRLENIHTESETFGPVPAARQEGDYAVLIPGIGALYQLSDDIGLLAGVHRGFSPLAPGQDDDVAIETSVNYELGGRYRGGILEGELIGYLSDYQNLLFTLTQSSGADENAVGKQFNAGSALIYGVEASLGATVEPAEGLELSLSGTYTLTMSRLSEDFALRNDQSPPPQFDGAEAGDRLPYVPEHQANLTFGAQVPVGAWLPSLRVSYTFVDAMPDNAANPDGDDAVLFTDVQHVVDVALQVETKEGGRFYLLANNLFDEAYVVSWRPLGARPGAPRFVRVGYSHTLDW